jgi:hypothetical protein
MARVRVTADTVSWFDLEQVHGDWRYDGPSFKFERHQYESALAAVEAAP